MPNIRKLLADKYALTVIILILLGAILRLYNFQSRIIFGPEQGMSLMTSATNLEKLSLLGETNWMRATSEGLIPFHGAFYSYFLLPFIVFFNYRVLPITFIFVLLNLLTGYCLYIISGKLFGKLVANSSLFYFMVSSVMIHHSLFPWIVNPTPLLAILSLWFISKIYKKKNGLMPALWLGIFSGLGFGMQNLYLPLVAIILIFILFFAKRKATSVLMFLVGILLGSLPTVIFDIRHDFYHLRVFSQFFLDVLGGKASGEFAYYNFLYLFPFLFISLGFITEFLFKKFKFFALLPLLFFVYVNLKSPLLNFKTSVGMPPGITLASLENTSSIIAKDNPPEKFNVVTLWDFDTRAHTLRYLLTYYHGLKPQGVEEYKNIDAVYAYTPSEYNIYEPRVFELSEFAPYKVIEIDSPVPGYKLYKLIK